MNHFVLYTLSFLTGYYLGLLWGRGSEAKRAALQAKADYFKRRGN